MNEYTVFGYDGKGNVIVYITAPSVRGPGGVLEQTGALFSTGMPDLVIAGLLPDLLESGYTVLEIGAKAPVIED